MQYVTQVTVAHIDRDTRRIVLDFNNNWLSTIQALEQAGVIDLTRDAILDPVYREFFVDRLKETLNAIGNPSVAIAHATVAVTAATGQARRPTRGAASTVSEVLWDAGALYAAPVVRTLAPVHQLLATNGSNLNSSQWSAWDAALSHRLRLIWGPPGTGKSRTLRAIILGALLDAVRSGGNLRVLLTGPTYEAIDNVLAELIDPLTGNSPLAVPGIIIARVRSSFSLPSARVAPAYDVPTQISNANYAALLQRLATQAGITLVAAPPQQAHKLLMEAGGAAAPLFDMIVIDEASQVDVATACLPLAGLAPAGSVVVAGDPKQLPPIHQAEPPLDLDYMVGPIFTYLQQRFNLTPAVLETNYRSCHEIVALAHLADYPRSLTAHSPDLRLNYVAPVSAGASPPPQWPAGLHWCEGWSYLLNRDQRATCFVYPEGRSSQWNEFEAQTIAALCWLLANSLGNQLENERDANGNTLGVTLTPYTPGLFWGRGIGIVTPHRAQQALVVARLQAIFPAPQHDHAAIRAAVDTVERFQGQQRDVMIATFALGDPDAISDEDEFLLSLNRFNVMASRARAKLIVLVSQEVVDHLSSDMDVLRGSALLKSFVDNHCSSQQRMNLGYMRGNSAIAVSGMHRWYG
jgi:DNA replication ATP-dependent helicase Dna2